MRGEFGDFSLETPMMWDSIEELIFQTRQQPTADHGRWAALGSIAAVTLAAVFWLNWPSFEVTPPGAGVSVFEPRVDQRIPSEDWNMVVLPPGSGSGSGGFVVVA